MIDPADTEIIPRPEGVIITPEEARRIIKEHEEIEAETARKYLEEYFASKKEPKPEPEVVAEPVADA